MKKLKNIILSFFALFLVSGVLGQEVGIRAGLNLSNMFLEPDLEGFNEETEPRTGYHFGLVFEYPIGEMLAVEGAALLSTKGFYLSETDMYFGQEVITRLYFNPLYLDVPITIKGSFEIKGVKVFVNAGPYFGFGIGGKWKMEMEALGEVDVEEDKIEYGENKNLKPTDFGATFGAGMEFNDINVGIFYSSGLINVSTTSNDDEKLRHQVLAISVGYKFDLGKR